MLIKYGGGIIPYGYEGMIPLYRQNDWGYNGMKGKFITIHNTGGNGRASDYAKSVENQLKVPNKGVATYHFCVDHEQIYQLLPINVNGWHSGDGDGPGNRKSIAIEVCQYYKNGEVMNCADFRKAEEKSWELAGQLCRSLNIEPSNTFFHYDWDIKTRKNCPMSTIYYHGLDSVNLEQRCSGNNSCPAKGNDVDNNVGVARKYVQDRISYYKNSSNKKFDFYSDSEISEDTHIIPDNGYDKEYSEYGSATFLKSSSINNSPSVSDKSGVQYDPGESVNYDYVIYNEGQIWIAYTRYSGSRGYVSTGTYDQNTLIRTSTWCDFNNSNHGGGYAKEYSEYGTVTFLDNCHVNNSPIPGDNTGTLYYIGETLNYDTVIFNAGYVWVSYIRGNGRRGYVATGNYNPTTLVRTETWCTFSSSGANIYDKEYFENGRATFLETCHINNSPNPGDNTGILYYPGEFVTYDTVIYNRGYIWVSYIRGNGTRGYVATGTYNQSNLSRTETWCVFE